MKGDESQSDMLKGNISKGRILTRSFIHTKNPGKATPDLALQSWGKVTSKNLMFAIIRHYFHIHSCLHILLFHQ